MKQYFSLSEHIEKGLDLSSKEISFCDDVCRLIKSNDNSGLHCGLVNLKGISFSATSIFTVNSSIKFIILFNQAVGDILCNKPKKVFEKNEAN